jgi:hypothetical protein
MNLTLSCCRFSPPTRQLTVKDKPLQGIDFSPLRATLTGQVVCLPTPCETLSITLSALDSELPPATQSVAADGSYTFTDVLPGQYEVCLHFYLFIYYKLVFIAIDYFRTFLTSCFSIPQQSFRINPNF